MRRGAGILGNVLGDFFGVTEVSQHGNRAEGRIGWEQYTERRVEEVRLHKLIGSYLAVHTQTEIHDIVYTERRALLQ